MRIKVNGIELSVQEAGPADGELVILTHGFPELGYSWRHQIPALAAAGLHVLVPDLRGYGDSDAPEAIEAYAIDQLTADVVGLIDWAGRDQAIVFGHDWGSELAWKTALLHPERVRAVGGLSVPFVPRPPVPPLPIMRQRFGDDFYIAWFQEPGVAEAALSRNVTRTLTTRRIWGPQWALEDDVDSRPPWMTADELAVYVEAFERTGFRGGLNYYRNIDRNWELTAPVADRRIEMPALFLTGERDLVRTTMPADRQRDWVGDLRAEVIVPGAGHWVTQESPAEVNAALLEFVAGLTA